MIPTMPVLLLWPVVALVLFKRLTPAQAIAWTVIAGYLLLPTQVRFNLPMLPALSKDTMPAIAALLGVLIFARGPSAPGVRPGILPRDRLGWLMVAGVVASAMFSVVTNRDTLHYGPLTLSGLGLYDVLAAAQSALVGLIPVLLARKYLSTPEDHKALLKVFCLAGSAYAVLTLYEVIMSPRLNVIVYGFFPGDWRQVIRDGGYRPLVFLKNGLLLAIFTSGAALAALGYLRVATGARRIWAVLAAVWLAAIMVLSHSLGALVITVLLAPVVLLGTVRLQLVLAGIVAASVLFYPALRGAGMVPVDRVVSIARSISPDRAASLQYRLNNEDILLAKANQRPLFGWGPWGRNRVYDDNGRDISTTDGIWVITIGVGGWFGYLSEFGLLAMPILVLAFRKRRYEVTLATSALCVVLAGNMMDLIPNAGLTPLTWLMAGALLGRLEVRGQALAEAPETAPARGRGPRYSRPRPAIQRNPPAGAHARSGYSRTLLSSEK